MILILICSFFFLSISLHPPPRQTSSLSLRGILQLLRQDATNSPHRRRRPRFVRRAVRRMRRWGLIPRPPSRPSQPSSSSQQQSEAAPHQEPAHSTPTSSSSAVEAVNQPVPQKLGLLAQSEQQQQQQGAPLPLLPLPVTSTPPPPYAPPAPPFVTPHTPPVAVPPSSPSLASIFHTLGLSISLFRASPSSSTNSMPLSASPSFSSSSDDDVLLIPLSEDTTSEDDVPMLTWMTSPLSQDLPHPLLHLLYSLIVTEAQSFHICLNLSTGVAHGETHPYCASLVPFCNWFLTCSLMESSIWPFV